MSVGLGAGVREDGTFVNGEGFEIAMLDLGYIETSIGISDQDPWVTFVRSALFCLVVV